MTQIVSLDSEHYAKLAEDYSYISAMIKLAYTNGSQL